MITVTDKALENLKKQLSTDELTLEIIVGGYSWSGVQFSIVQAEQLENHFASQFDNFNVIVDKGLLESFDAFTIDYQKHIFGSGIIVRRG